MNHDQREFLHVTRWKNRSLIDDSNVVFLPNWRNEPCGFWTKIQHSRPILPSHRYPHLVFGSAETLGVPILEAPWTQLWEVPGVSRVQLQVARFLQADFFSCHRGFDVCGVVVSWDQWPATRKWRAQALNNQISKLTRVRVVFITPLINTLRLVEQEKH